MLYVVSQLIDLSSCLMIIYSRMT